MNLLLIHGQGRTTGSMRLLGFRLARRGHSVRYFRYYTWREKFTKIAERLTITAKTLYQNQPYVIVAHSMGGLLARASLPALVGQAPSHLIMMASPSRVPRISPRFHRNPIYRLLTYNCGQQVTRPEFFAKLPQPTIPTTVIAGTGGPSGKWFPIGDEPNDSVLTVDETRLSSAHELITVRALHTFIMNSYDAYRHIDQIMQLLETDDQ